MTRRLSLALAASSLLLPTAAASAAPKPLHPGPVVLSAAAKKKAATAPVIKSITPKKAKIGDKLTITGKNFVAGKDKNRVFFYKVGGGSAWVSAATATKTKIVVTIPDKLGKLLPTDGKSARVQLRVLAKSFGTMSPRGISPLIAIKPAGDSGNGSGPGAGVATCTPNASNPASDVDGDRLTDAIEVAVKTDPCNKDSDGDGLTDGYEYYSAKDLNSAALPYPVKRPYPNPLFADAGIDYDGDGLTDADEFALWTKFGGSTFPMNFSAGKQRSQTVPAPDPSGPLYYQDIDHDGFLSDDEIDSDGDGIGNWDESHGRMVPAWWNSVYNKDPFKETPYVVSFAGTDMLDPDSDGDTVPDGVDDNDFDGLSNAYEIDRPLLWNVRYVSVGYGIHNYDSLTNLPKNPDQTQYPGVTYSFYARVQPFNPCKPVWSGVCHVHWPFDYYSTTEDWMGWGGPGTSQPLPSPGTRPGQS